MEEKPTLDFTKNASASATDRVHMRPSVDKQEHITSVLSNTAGQVTIPMLTLEIVREVAEVGVPTQMDGHRRTTDVKAKLTVGSGVTEKGQKLQRRSESWDRRPQWKSKR